MINPEKFLETLPKLLDTNLASGDIANEKLPSS